MLLHGFGLSFVLAVYVCAVPIVVDREKDEKKKLRPSRSIITLPLSRDEYFEQQGKEPWEVNENLLKVQGVKSFDGNSDLYQGDIVLDPDTRLLLRGDALPSRRRRAVKKLQQARWPNGVVPYLYSKDLAEDTKHEIKRAMRHWKRKTCIQFRRKREDDKDYVFFVDEPGCWSHVGRRKGQQKISIGPGCVHVGTIIHEIGHAVGFWHEQSRRDRDDYIKILTNNIEGSALDQFNKMPKQFMDFMGYAYDYFCIMHYGLKFFSKNNKPTIKQNNKTGRRIKATLRVGQRSGLSWIDVAQINAMYNCSKMSAREQDECFNSTTGDGQDYRGTLNYTNKGVLCQPWNHRWPHDPPEMKTGDPASQGLGRHNYCRNPGGSKRKPWCYTTLKRQIWQYCNVTICNPTRKRGSNG